MRRFFLVLAFFFSATVHASNSVPYETGGWLNGLSGTYYWPSAIAACIGYTHGAAGYSGHTLKNHQLSPAMYICEVTYKNPIYPNDPPSTFNIGNVWIVAGSKCPDDTTQDPATGECRTDNPCAPLAGGKVQFSQVGKAPDSVFSITPSKMAVRTQSHGCFNGCVAEIPVQGGCKFWSSGHYKCNQTGIYTGQQCSDSGSDDLSSTPTPQDTEAEKIDSQEPCEYVTKPDGSQECSSSTSTETTGDNGDKDCGEINGKTTCVQKPPKKDQLDVDTKIETKPTPDGGSETVKTDTATQTTCVGINACSTTVTTTVTTTKKDPEGKTTSESSICTGPLCASSPKGGSDDKDGDGLSDCGVNGCSEFEGGGDGTGEGFGEVGGYGDSVQDFLGRLEASPIASALTAISFPTGGSCSFPSVDVEIIGRVSLDSFCDLADVLDPLFGIFLAIWCLAGVRVVMSA